MDKIAKGKHSVEDYENLLLGVLARLREILPRLEKLTRRLSNLEGAFDELSSDLRWLTDGLDPGKRDLPSSRGWYRVSTDQDVLRRMAVKGALRLEWGCVSEDGAEVRIDGSDWIWLTRSQAGLLRVLADPKGEKTDDLAGWKSEQSVRTSLGMARGVPISKKGLNQLVYTLRRRLVAHGVNGWLVQTSPRRGLRFALKQGTPPDRDQPG